VSRSGAGGTDNCGARDRHHPFRHRLELGLSAFFGGGLGLVIALLVARSFAAASFVMSLLEVAVSAFAVLVSMLAAVLGALTDPLERRR